MGHFNITIKHQSLTAAIHCYSNCRYLLFNVFFNLFFLWLIKRLSGTWASIGPLEALGSLSELVGGWGGW